jgi:putative transposase
MQIKYLHKKLCYVRNGIDEREYSQVVYDRLKKLKQFKELKSQHCSDQIIFSVLEVPRSTLYRWKRAYEQDGLAGLENRSRAPDCRRKSNIDPVVEKLIIKIRKANPIWGKKKIAVILKRDHGITLSMSATGRVLTRLIKQGKIQPARFYYGRIKNKKRREFANHAQRWQYGMRSTSPGELIQIDHAVVEIEPNYWVKQFDATCPITKITVSQVYARATSTIAAQFLAYIQEQFPFQIKSIQVDGGSEFMGEFEAVCQSAGIALFVLPPRSPEYNGNVERRHATIKYEFFSTYDGSANLQEIRVELAKFMVKYNTYRPHESLNFDTPLGYYLNMEAKSHM